MKPTIKKKIKNLIIPTATTLIIAISLSIGTIHVFSEKAIEDLPSLDQINEYQEFFNTIDGYQHTNGDRLKHNGDEPIYIEIDNKFSPTQQETIKQALDFIFGLVGDINKNYRYEIVQNINDKQYSNKTKIKFNLEDKVIFNNEEVDGLYTTYLHASKSNKKGIFINHGNVFIEDDNAKDLDELYYTTLHETFHLFGVKDVYLKYTDQRYNNTYINVNTNHDLKMITPNDYKLLISLYAKDIKTLTDNEKQEYTSQLEEKIEDYTIKYFSHYQEVYKQSLIDKGFSENLVKENTSYYPLENNIDVTFVDTLSTKGISTIRVKVKNDKYVIATYDENNNLLENCTGKAYNVGGQIFLHNVALSNLKNGDQTYADLCVEMFAKNTKYCRLRDTMDTIYSAAGINTEHYQQQNEELIQ